MRPGIEIERYHNQIQLWLNQGSGIDEITATMLQKAVGGQYKKAVNILDEFKVGYETKELSDLPEPPEQLTNVLNAATLEIWRLLWSEKNAEVTAACAEFENEKAKLNSVAEERLELIAQLEKQQEQLEQQVAQLTKDANSKDERLANLRGRFEENERQFDDLKKRIVDEQLAANKWQAEAEQWQQREAEASKRADKLQDELLTIAKSKKK